MEGATGRAFFTIVRRSTNSKLLVSSYERFTGSIPARIVFTSVNPAASNAALSAGILQFHRHDAAEKAA